LDLFQENKKKILCNLQAVMHQSVQTFYESSQQQQKVINASIIQECIQINSEKTSPTDI
jgi:hypothetical protein